MGTHHPDLNQTEKGKCKNQPGGKDPHRESEHPVARKYEQRHEHAQKPDESFSGKMTK